VTTSEQAVATDSPKVRTGIVVCSDRARSGEYVDKSGPAAATWLNAQGYESCGITVIADDAKALERAVREFAETCPLIVVSGGTGIGERDITPQTLDKFCDYEIPGVGEVLRAESLKLTPNAWLSRCSAWMLGRRLVLALPGNPKAVVEQLDILGQMLPKAMRSINGTCDHRK